MVDHAGDRRRIRAEDVLSIEDFEAIRSETYQSLRPRKALRRVAVGPYATLYFECYDTMWWQIHEMLRIEKGGAAQIDDELAAYNPLIPQGRELVATFMIEIDDPVRRARELVQLGGIEDTVALVCGDAVVAAVPEDDVERTNAVGKTSSIHFLHFPMTAAAMAQFKNADTECQLRIRHAAYGHAAILADTTRRELIGDLE